MISRGTSSRILRLNSSGCATVASSLKPNPMHEDINKHYMGKQASNPMPEEHASPPATAKIGPSQIPDLPLALTSNATHKDVHKYNTEKQAPTPVPDKHAPTEPIRTFSSLPAQLCKHKPTRQIHNEHSKQAKLDDTPASPPCMEGHAILGQLTQAYNLHLFT